MTLYRVFWKVWVAFADDGVYPDRFQRFDTWPMYLRMFGRYYWQAKPYISEEQK